MAWKAIARDDASWAGVVFRCAKFTDEKIEEVTSFNIEVRDAHSISTTAPFLQDHEAISFMQAVMDAAYEYGLRPSNVQDEKHLHEHLKDMREISRHLLKMDK